MTVPSHGRSGRPWKRIRLQILERDRYLCQIRGPKCRGRADTVDHIVPLAFAPHLAHDPSNLRAACKACNSRLGQRITTAKRKLNGTEAPPPWVKKKQPRPFVRPNRGVPFRRPEW